MKNFDFFEHESDMGVSVEADTLEELFVSSAEALFSLIAKKNSEDEKLSYNIEIKSDSLEELLVEWLNELIVHFELFEFYGKVFNLKILKNDKGVKLLKANVNGEKINWDKDEIRHEVKAATYHQLKIVQKDGKYQVRIIFDL